jgi:hypothetical protein
MTFSFQISDYLPFRLPITFSGAALQNVSCRFGIADGIAWELVT